VTPNVGRLMGMALKAVKNIRQPLWMDANEWESGGCEDGDLVMFKNTISSWTIIHTCVPFIF